MSATSKRYRNRNLGHFFEQQISPEIIDQSVDLIRFSIVNQVTVWAIDLLISILENCFSCLNGLAKCVYKNSMIIQVINKIDSSLSHGHTTRRTIKQREKNYSDCVLLITSSIEKMYPQYLDGWTKEIHENEWFKQSIIELSATTNIFREFLYGLFSSVVECYSINKTNSLLYIAQNPPIYFQHPDDSIFFTGKIPSVTSPPIILRNNF